MLLISFLTPNVPPNAQMLIEWQTRGSAYHALVDDLQEEAWVEYRAD